MSHLEAIIERFGTASQIQEFRWDMGRVVGEDPDKIFRPILKTEYKLRCLVQQEVKAQKFLAKRYKSKQEKHLCKEILHRVEEGYAFLCKTWENQRKALPDGHLKRGFAFCRSHTTWYMHPSLVKDCAGKGGCCARGCGCCARRASVPTRALGAGHCTLDCVCCMKVRGVELKVEIIESKELLGHSSFSEYKLGKLPEKMKQAILLGVDGTVV